jgi:energy-coupling factor transporter ATP-binding protein EcfA2
MIIEYTDKGPRRLTPPADRYFRGTVIGDLDSAVMLASGSKVRGFVYTNGKFYAIAPDRNVYGDDTPEPVSRLRQVDPERDRPADVPLFHCDTESLVVPSAATSGTMVASALDLPSSCGGNPSWTSTVYTITLRIETDYELYSKFGSTSGELRYIGDLTAAASGIYWRDISTVFQISDVHVYSSTNPPDYPWSGPYASTSALLYALGDYWHNNFPKSSFPRTIVHMLSGKALGGGVSWLSALCASDMLCNNNCGDSSANGHYAGGYGLSAQLNGTFSTTSPNLYWDILCYTHEIGHNFASPHTECYTPQVDTCTPCNDFSCTGPVPSGGGTIMSYCHACFGGFSNIILYFGQSGQPSQAVRDCMRAFVERSSCLGGLAAAPTVSAVNPPSGSTSGGTSVTISGTGFQYYATVTIGGVNATNVTTVNSTTITATTGAHAAGTVNVVVQNPDSQIGTKTNGYTYGSSTAPVVTSVYPNFGPVAGGTGIAITGSLFVNGATVTLGGTSATGVTFVNSTTITATTAAHTTGSVNVVVQNPDAQTGTLVNGYFYGPPTTTGALFYPLTPCRVLDTRNATGPLGGPVLAAGGTRSFTVLTAPSTCSIPLTAKTLSVNVTITMPTANGELRVFPGNGLVPATTVISFKAGQTRPNNAHVLLATDGSGSFKVQNTSAGTVHFLVDVNGYYQ